MSTKAKAIAAGGGFVVLVAVIVLALGGRDGSSPLSRVLNPEPETCPLTGLEPRNESVLERPAVAVKIVNSSSAYPLSGLEDAEIVYEELVEGGGTRFMAIYHCTDASQAGPIRSAREVDPTIMTPTTRILVFSGANKQVLAALSQADVVQIEENVAGDAMERVDRPGVSFEYTLYADTKAARKLGRRQFEDPPPGDSYQHGDLEGRFKRAKTVTLNFSGAVTVGYTYQNGKWLRTQAGEPFVTDAGEQVAVDNVLVEQHDYEYSNIKDVAGNYSVYIRDVTGKGKAFLFRDGRVIPGRWERESVEGAVRFTTRKGDDMVLAPGSTWIHLVPNDEGEATGSFSYER